MYILRRHSETLQAWCVYTYIQEKRGSHFQALKWRFIRGLNIM